ncbi:MAG: hypothetical protein ACKVRN_03490 [Pyrinomonadaceae bacterium]
MTWLTWAIPLVIVVFLWSLNEFMRGKLSQILSGVLALIIISLVIVAFFVSGWKFGLGALFSAFVLGALLNYPAGIIASKFFKY